jgi:hypothetical protein
VIHACDVETYLITPGNPIPEMVCLSYASANGDKGVLLKEDGLDWLERVLEAGDHIVAHNARFDLAVCAAERPSLLVAIFEAYTEGRIHDTGLRQKILDNAKGELKYIFNEETGEFKGQLYDLASVLYRRLGKWRFGDKEGDVWRIRFSLLAGIPVEDWPPSARKYALEDSVDALALFLDQENDYHCDLLEHEWSQCQADWALGLMSIWGSRTNAEDIAILKEEFQEAYNKQVKKCRKYNLLHRKKEKGKYKWARKMNQIYDLVEETYAEHGLKVPMTKGGKTKPKVSTSRDTLLMREYPKVKAHPGMVAVAELVRIGKLLSTYIPMLELGTILPINPRYNAILETFRTSCSGPNIQNLPREGGVRDCWEARPNYIYSFADYDTLEMRTLAQVCIWLFGHSEIAEAIKEGRDLHAALAALILGMEYEEVLEGIANGDSELKDARQYCKIGNYGLSGGMGHLAFIEYARGAGIDISVEKAKELHRGFRMMWPEMVRYFVHCSEVAEDKDPDTGINQVEFFVSGLIRGDVRYTAVCNGYFQNLAAMGAKMALFEVAKLCYTDESSPLFGCRPWLFAHDEIGMEIPFHGTDACRVKAAKATEELARVMRECMEVFVPDVPIGVTGAMCFTWIKGAKPVYRKINGKKTLVPCKMDSDENWVEDFARDEQRMAA